MRIANFKKLKHFFFSEKTEEMKSYYKDNLAYSRKFKTVDGPFGLNPCNPVLLTVKCAEKDLPRGMTKWTPDPDASDPFSYGNNVTVFCHPKRTKPE